MCSPPVPYCVYIKCVELERAAVEGTSEEKMGRLRELYEKAVREHGSSQVGRYKVTRESMSIPLKKVCACKNS